MNRRSLLLAAASVVALASFGVTPPRRITSAGDSIKSRAIRQLKAMPIAFETNVGQTSGDASFVARGQGYAVWATANGPVLRLRDARASKPGATVRLRVVGGAATGQPSPESRLPGRANYFIGNDPSRWRTNVTRFGALRYTSVYPGVDLVLHGTQESLEYDFAVAPHADPSQIAVAFDGATDVRIDANGDLALTVNDGELSFHPPVAYQERNGERDFVAARYDLGSDNIVRFALSAYDRTRPLVIDPVLSYSTYLGGQHNNFGGLFPGDEGFSLAVDAAGNAYLAGFTAAIDFPMAGTPFDTTCGGCTNSGGDGWVAKLDPSQSGAASLMFATYLGSPGTGSGTGSTRANGVAVDNAGNVYVTGTTTAFDNPATPGLNEGFPTTATAFQATSGGSYEAFLTKLDPTGSALLYSTYIGGMNSDEGNAVKADDVGNAIVAGRSEATNFPGLKNAFQNTNKGIFDAFVVKIDTTVSGTAGLKYGTFLGGSSNDAAGAVALDSQGRIYVTGDTQSTTTLVKFPTFNGFQTTGGGGSDAFMAKIDPSAVGAASLLYSTFIGSDGDETVSMTSHGPQGGIGVDANGIVYVAGSTNGGFNLPFPTTQGAYKTVHQSTDAYVVKIDPTKTGAQSLLASTLLGGSFADSATSVTVDASGNPVVSGFTGSSDFGITGCGLAKKANTDLFVVVLDPSLSGLKFSTMLGGDGGDWAYGVGVGPQGQIYLAGSTDSLNFPTTANGFDPTPQSQCNGCGSYDAFLTVISSPLDVCPVGPVAFGSSASTAEDTAVSVALTASDLDGNNATPDSLTWMVTTPPAHGMLGLSSGSMAHGFGPSYSASVSYTPAANYFGSDSFQFRVNDGTANSNIATVSINISSVNDAPTALPQNVTTAEETPKQITLTGSDPENNLPFTFTVNGNPAHGVLSGSGAVRTYTPALNYFGPDSFTFYVTDSLGAASTPATISITVTNVNDAPSPTTDSATTAEDTPVTVNVLANDNDVDNDTLSVTAVSCNNGAGAVINADKSVTVTPALNFNGSIACSYTVSDGNGGSATGQLNVVVNSVNDAPTTSADSVTTPEDQAVTVNVLANDNDVDKDTLNVTAASCDNGAGAVINADKSVTVTPVLNFNGAIACTYTISDGHGGSANGQLNVDVTPVNDAPTTGADAATTNEDQAVTVNVLANDNDVDKDTLSVTAASCNNGAGAVINADKSVTVTPALNFNGAIACTYTISDGHGGSANGQLDVNVLPVNDAPVAMPDFAWTNDNKLVVVAVLGNDSDPDGDLLQLNPTITCQFGTATANLDQTLTYKPKAGFGGVDQCTYSVSDGNGGVATGSLTVNITKLNDPPTVTNPGDQLTPEGGAVSLTLTATDPDDDPLTYSATGLPAGLVMHPDGIVDGAPAAGSAGSYLVKVTVEDGSGGSTNVQFTWVVTAPVDSTQPNQAPVCTAAVPSVSSLWPPNHQLVPVQILGVIDPDGGAPAIKITRILQDEPTNTIGDGSTWIDGFGIGTPTATVRAERAGTPKVPGDGRVYEIFFTATDVTGATCTGSVSVGVPHDQGTGPAVDSGVRYDSTVAGGQPIIKP